jgi:hypothetical protein
VETWGIFSIQTSFSLDYLPPKLINMQTALHCNKTNIMEFFETLLSESKTEFGPAADAKKYCQRLQS